MAKVRRYAYKCEHCGRDVSYGTRYRVNGILVCAKHYNQYKKYGKFLDNIPRTILDPNEIQVCGDIAYIDIYDLLGNVVTKAIIDTEDIDKVKDIKWHSTKPNGIIVTMINNRVTPLGRYILGISDTDIMVYYRDHNLLNNCKNNLIIGDQYTMHANRSSGFLKFKGVRFLENRQRWVAYIKYNQKNHHIIFTKSLDEAKFARITVENLIYGDKIEKRALPNIQEDRQKEITNIVVEKLKKKGII